MKSMHCLGYTSLIICANMAVMSTTAFAQETPAPAIAAVAESSPTPALHEPIITEATVYEEVDGKVIVEAEHFYKQTLDEVRRWYRTSAQALPQVEPDGDPPHLESASGGMYVEVLPDTRQTHNDTLVRGENFSPEPGKVAILHYRVKINTPGRYYVWARIYSVGTEDNGLHVGINGTWPEHGRQMQWTAKRKWFWDSKQRTQTVHTGVPGEIYLDITEPGIHEIMFSMREDGVEFDKWLLTTNKDFVAPNEIAPPAPQQP